MNGDRESDQQHTHELRCMHAHAQCLGTTMVTKYDEHPFLSIGVHQALALFPS